jgi:hypothetical protein
MNSDLFAVRSDACGIFIRSRMPYRGDSPAEAWEYWFDEPSSETVRLALELHSNNQPADTIIEAMEITSDKLDITAEALVCNTSMACYVGRCWSL